MTAFISSLLPIMILIFSGYGLKRARFLSTEAWSGMERLTYYVLFPALLVHTLANQSIMGTPWPSILVVVMATLLVVTVVLILWHRFRSSIKHSTFTSIFQGGVRFNTYIALALAQALYGSEGLALGSVAAGFMIVLVNLACISVFALWDGTKVNGLKPFVVEVVANPLIIACALGWLLSLTGIGLPGITEDVFNILSRAALPFGLLAVGAALKPELIAGHLRPMIISSSIQFGLKPLTAALLISATGLSGIAAAVVVIIFISPTAPSGYILARQLGGDTETMASIISFQTLLAFLAMPLLALLLMN